MIYGYIRISTDRQNTENQKFEIQNFVQRSNMAIDGWLEDIGDAEEGDIVIASEISQLGRDPLQVVDVLKQLLNSGAQVWTIKDGYKLGGDASGKMLAFAFGLSEEIKRKMISKHTKEALARVKADGKALGRPVGRRNSKSKLSERAGEVGYLLSSGFSRSEVARKLKVHRNTLIAFLREKE